MLKFKYSWSEWIARIICVWMISLFLGDAFLTIFNVIFKMKSSLYQILGIWAENLYHGHFFVNVSNIEPSVSQSLLGFAVHSSLALVFSIIYVIIIYVRFDFNHRFRDGLIYGLCLILFPLFVELPAFGFGILGIKMPHYFLVISRTIAFHLIFGLGMALGLTLYEVVFKKIKD